MITSEDKLKIFENFHTDYNLPKFQEDEDEGEGYAEDSGGIAFKRKGVRLSNFRSSDGLEEFIDGGLVIEGRPPWHVRWWRGFWGFVLPKPDPEPEPTMTVLEFFTSVQNSTEELEVVKRRAAGYEQAIRKAKNSGQQALLEALLKGQGVHRSEAQLAALKLFKYVSEDTIVRFVKQSPKGLRLDWVANFTRPIPEDLLDLKKKADEREAFDNYVVLHYDPDAKSWAETQAEKEARKDPILFGVMEGSRKLYYVGDWKDEFCDLTLDEIADQLGQEAVGSLKETS